MKNEKSYAELMKSCAMNRQNEEANFMLDLYVDMILSEAMLKAEKTKLLKQIDLALDHRDKVAFNSLCKQLKELNVRFGT
ncbi:IDEAL domain-containing protein [Bacillus aquiflavi]|uniref:IDEAL domain-containing protein n=1 Tax=Bacillus aquiflavi TaxID=2672567 RepID=A0A6B3VS92_9BACI|nr:IDEAL domain-containing protein [Bacillus aquiflavi]MBA4535702.1 IDEAL domain-containing protein [Bacillus aquiflavi]NEY80078.1 IDEAL domain-containing protein [Bacillus aquiflavi]